MSLPVKTFINALKKGLRFLVRPSYLTDSNALAINVRLPHHGHRHGSR